MSLGIKTIKVVDSFNTSTPLGLITILEFPPDTNPSVGMILKGLEGSLWTIIRIGIKGYLEYSKYSEDLKKNKNLWVCGLKPSEHNPTLRRGDTMEISSVPN